MTRIDGKLLKRLKIRAAREETSIKALIERAAQAYLATPINQGPAR